MEAEFNFFQQWYPVSPVIDINPKQPTAITVLGINLVIWQAPNAANHQVFLDQCPHRLAPLSEGRIDEKTGNLMCSYHGWQFNCQGVCTHIPQAEDTEIINKNQDNFSAVVFPTREKQELLWVWLDPQSSELAEKTPLPLSSQIDASKGFVWSSFVRDLEYDWQTLIENVVDPSHVPFAHHGVQGNRNQAIPIAIKIIQSTANLIEAKTNKHFSTTITFQPPCRLEYAIALGNTGKQIGLVTYCLPIMPGKSRLVALFPRNFAQQLHYLTPRWWNHVKVRNLVLDGDMILLHQQERLLQQKQQNESWKTAYKLPTNADRLVIEFRKWFDECCGSKLPWEKVGIIAPKILPTNKTRQEILDRYHQHTQHCSSCRGALKTIQRLQIFLLIYFVVTVTGVTILPESLRIEWGLPLMAIALWGLSIYAWLKFWLQPQFYFVDYIHAEKK